MACISDEEWTMHMLNDQPGSEEDIIIFCINIENGVVSGSVTDADGNPLSTDTRVKGVRVPIGNVNLMISDLPVREHMSLRFRWDKGTKAIKVLLMGSVYEQEGLTRFGGRFLAYPGQLPIVESRKILAGPDTGDTGTGNGTQT